MGWQDDLMDLLGHIDPRATGEGGPVKPLPDPDALSRLAQPPPYLRWGGQRVADVVSQRRPLQDLLLTDQKFEETKPTDWKQEAQRLQAGTAATPAGWLATPATGTGRTILEPGTRRNIMAPDTHPHAGQWARVGYQMEENRKKRGTRGKPHGLKGLFGGGEE